MMRHISQILPSALEAFDVPELSSCMEGIEATSTWLKLLAPHTPRQQKSLLMEMHGYGQVSDNILSALFTLLRLGRI